jgi:flagellar hook-basal body complex protein FliE
VTVVPLDRLRFPSTGDDAPLAPFGSGAPPDAAGDFSAAVGEAFETVRAALARAGSAEQAFAARTGGLQEMVLERTQADVLLSLATATASRTAQAISTILGMQV